VQDLVIGSYKILSILTRSYAFFANLIVVQDLLIIEKEQIIQELINL